jgi:hypothetical protein
MWAGETGRQRGADRGPDVASTFLTAAIDIKEDLTTI